MSDIYYIPRLDNSNLIKTKNAILTKLENNINIKYKVPISLVFNNKNHLSYYSIGYLNSNIVPRLSKLF